MTPAATGAVGAGVMAVGAQRAPEAAAAPLAAFAVAIDLIAPDPEQPRRSFSEERLQVLAASIRAVGVIHPLVVVPHPDRGARAVTPYQLLVGERRWLAARRAGLAAVPIVVREQPLAASDRLMLQLAESDGEHREELSLFDVATAVGRAFELARCTQVQFAQRHRRTQSWLSNLLHVAHVQGLAREALQEGLLQGILAARTYLRLTVSQQRSLLLEARRTQLPITLNRAEKAAAETEDRRRHRHLHAVAAGGGPGDEDVEEVAPAGSPLASGPWRQLAPAPEGAGMAGEDAGGAGGSGGDLARSVDTRSSVEAMRAPLANAEPAALPFPLRAAPGTRLGGPWITLEITVLQLATLLIRLGQEPSGSPRDMAEQLFACL